MSAREFTEWMVFDAHEPIGGRRGDMQAAHIMAVLAEIYRDREKRSEPYAVNEFMPRFWQESRAERSLEDWREYLALLNTIYGGVDKRDGNGWQSGN